ncbi:hypothetical protein ABEH08_22725 [Pantoea agglomerans]|uniref:hypothetical protein n=1 Tax=Enterobacter agglomerans TaxID=549 RepID=UPI001654BB20|nr:hypothetical protein [Pantoea agglomerans]
MIAVKGAGTGKNACGPLSRGKLMQLYPETEVSGTIVQPAVFILLSVKTLNEGRQFYAADRDEFFRGKCVCKRQGNHGVSPVKTGNTCPVGKDVSRGDPLSGWMVKKVISPDALRR